MLSKADMEKVGKVYTSTMLALDEVLIGQKNVKEAIASSMLSDANSRILFVGNTGFGKSTLSNFLASHFNNEKIYVTNDMLSSEIREQLKDKREMQSLQIEEFNRVSGKTQSAFIELFSDNKITIEGKEYPFSDFYVFATQNNDEISGVFSVPQAVYDRIDLCLYFEKLTEEEKRTLLFGNFEPAKKGHLDLRYIKYVQEIVKNFQYDEKDIDIIMKATDYIDNMQIHNTNLFSGSNMRGHFYLKKLAALSAIVSGKNFILPSDIAKYVRYLYMHRINQNVASIASPEVVEVFNEVEDDILSLKRGRK